MSYCRSGDDSDVYVYRSQSAGEPAWYCHGGWHDPGVVKLISLVLLKEHLQEHASRGDKVPVRAFERIEREIKETGRDGR